MFGAMARGKTVIHGALSSQDVERTRQAMEALGAQIKKDHDLWIVTGSSLREPEKPIDAGNSGTTTRLLSGILAGIDGVSIITGDDSLKKRPMKRIMDPLSAMGASFMARKDNYLPMAIRGSRLVAMAHEMKTASAQVKSAILLAGMSANGRTSVKEPSKSRDHTERMLEFFGAAPEMRGNTVAINGPVEIEAREIVVGADPSSAAFPAVWAAATPGSFLILKGVCLNPTRTAFLDVLARMGADISMENEKTISGEPIGDICVKGSGLQATIIKGKEIPRLIDELPVLAVAACMAEGQSIIRDAAELRVKETDRIKAMVQGLEGLGARVEEQDDGMIIHGKTPLHTGSIQTFSDHRIAMSFFILSKIADIAISMDDTSCVDISYPAFFDDMKALLP